MPTKKKVDFAAYHADINAAREKALKEYVERLKESQPAPVMVVNSK